MSTPTVPPKQGQKPTVAAEVADPMLWVRGHQKLVLGLAAALAVVALGTWLVLETGQRRQLRAAESLDQARNIAESGNLPLAANELQKIIETYKGTDAASEAVVTLNQVRMVNGQSELAIVGLQEYLKGTPKKVYRVPALGLLGEALENAGRPAEAAESYVSASTDAEVDYLKAQYLLFAARAYRDGGKPDEAAKVLQKILADFPNSTAVTEAKIRLAELTQGRMVMAN